MSTRIFKGYIRDLSKVGGSMHMPIHTSTIDKGYRKTYKGAVNFLLNWIEKKSKLPTDTKQNSIKEVKKHLNREPGSFFEDCGPYGFGVNIEKLRG